MADRRQFLGYAAAGSLAGAGIDPARAAGTAGAVSADRPLSGLDFAALQRAQAALYDVDRKIVNFDAACYGAMTRETQARYFEKLQWVNRHNSTFLRSAVEGLRGIPS